MNYDHLIELQNVSKIYPGTTAAGVQAVDLTIEQGAITVIAGESGSGKSTLLKLINGLISPDQGHILFKNEEVRGPEGRLIPGHDAMKVVAQDFSLNIYASVYDNIASLLPNTDLKAKKQKTFEVMEFLKIDQLAEKRAIDLSGGEQQRVAIARAVVTEPEVLLMDEPFSQIDAMLKSELRGDIKRMAQYLGITILLVSHDPLDGLSLADKMVILKDGMVVESGHPRQLYNNPGTLYTAQLLSSCNVISSEEATLIGIQSEKETVVIYPEWVSFTDIQDSGDQYLFKGSFFKGFYEEISLEKNGVQIRALHPASVNYKKDTGISIRINRYLEF